MPDGMAETHMVGYLLHMAAPGQSKSVVHAMGVDDPLNRYAMAPLASWLMIIIQRRWGPRAVLTLFEHALRFVCVETDFSLARSQR